MAILYASRTVLTPLCHTARCLLTLTLMLAHALAAMGGHIDSLVQVLALAHSDTAKHRLLIDIGKSYRDSNYVRALDYFKQSLDVVEHSRYKAHIAKSYHMISYVYTLQGEVDLALSNLNNALVIYDALGDDGESAGISNDIGVAYKNKGKYDVATHYLMRAMSLYEKTHDVLGIARVTNNLGQVQYFMRNYASAIEHFTHYYEVNQQLNKPQAMAGAANNIASAYLELGEFDKAIDYYFVALGIYDSLGFRLGQAVILDNLGSLFYEIARYDEALKHHQEAIAIFEELQSTSRLALSKQNLAMVLLKQHQLDRAIEELNMARDMVQPLGRIEQLRDIYLLLAEAHEMGRSFQLAYSFLKEYRVLNDSIVSTETLQNIERIKAEHEAEKRKRTEEATSRMLALNRWLVVAVSVALLALLGLLAAMQRNHKLRRNHMARLNGLNQALLDGAARLLNTSAQQLTSPPLSPFVEEWSVAPQQGPPLPQLHLRCQALQGHTLLAYIVLQRSAQAQPELVDLAVSQFLAQLPAEPDMEHIDLRLHRHLASSSLTAHLSLATDYSIWPIAVRGYSVLCPTLGMASVCSNGQLSPLPDGHWQVLCPGDLLYVQATAEVGPPADFMQLINTLVQYPFGQQRDIAANSLSIVEMDRTSLICALRVGSPSTDSNHQITI